MEHTPTDDDIATLSVGELKALISGAGLSYADCVEKSDLRARAAEARARLPLAPVTRSNGGMQCIRKPVRACAPA